MRPSALFGGLLLGVLSALPFVNTANCCCLWLLSGGVLAVWIEEQDSPDDVGLAAGARCGFRAGVVGAFVWLVVAPLTDALVGPAMQQLVDVVAGGAADMPAEARRWLDGLRDQPTGVLKFLPGFLFQLLIAPAFASAGGMLGAAVLKRGR